MIQSSPAGAEAYPNACLFRLERFIAVTLQRCVGKRKSLPAGGGGGRAGDVSRRLLMPLAGGAFRVSVASPWGLSKRRAGVLFPGPGRRPGVAYGGASTGAPDGIRPRRKAH